MKSRAHYKTRLQESTQMYQSVCRRPFLANSKHGYGKYCCQSVMLPSLNTGNYSCIKNKTKPQNCHKIISTLNTLYNLQRKLRPTISSSVYQPQSHTILISVRKMEEFYPLRRM